VIRGEPADLAIWQQVLKHASVVWVETTSDGETVLRATALNELKSKSEVCGRAMAYIDRLNGAMALSQRAKPVRFGEVIIRFKDGRLHRSLIAKGGVYESRVLPISLNQATPSEVQRWSALADQETWLHEALTYFGRGANWFDIYKALELLIKFKGKKWAKSNGVGPLKQTANSFRHADRKKYPSPPKPMDLDEGHRLLGDLLRRALQELQKGLSP
jgi:hypothetical protein